jgi:hypothetical protein
MFSEGWCRRAKSAPIDPLQTEERRIVIETLASSAEAPVLMKQHRSKM